MLAFMNNNSFLLLFDSFYQDPQRGSEQDFFTSINLSSQLSPCLFPPLRGENSGGMHPAFGGELNSDNIPSVSSDSNVSASLGIGNNKINVKLNKEQPPRQGGCGQELNISNLDISNNSSSEFNITHNITEGLPNLTNNFPASSIFESSEKFSNELFSIVGDNPYLQLQYLILFKIIYITISNNRVFFIFHSERHIFTR